MEEANSILEPPAENDPDNSNLSYFNQDVDISLWTKFWEWKFSSPREIKSAEDELLSILENSCNLKYVNIGPLHLSENGEDCYIWTISVNEKSLGIPLVLVHGLGSGIALWALNLDDLAKDRPVYSFSLPGFGRSSRPQFRTEDSPEIIESQFVHAIEKWREKMKIEKCILCGHSFGSFLSYSYAILWPKRVSHLILIDPWGFAEFDMEEFNAIPLNIRLTVRIVELANPLFFVRLFGPFGKYLIQLSLQELIREFEKYIQNASDKVGSYLYHCNCENPTGETAFHSLMVHIGWAKQPMVKRIQLLDKNIPITLIYGMNSWVRHLTFETFKEMRPNSFVEGFILDASHHLYAEKANEFGNIVSQQINTVEQLQLK